MRALVFDGTLKYVSDYPEPSPSHGEALVRVRLAGVCATDLEIAKGYMGFKGILGHEFTGVVEKCGDRALTGKRVVGEINAGCGSCSYCKGGLGNHCPERKVLGIRGKDGAFADYLTLPVGNLHVIPDVVSDEEAVFIEPLAAAFEVIEQTRPWPGTRVLVLGDGRLGLLTAEALSLTGCSLVAAGRHREKLSILGNRGINTVVGSGGLKRDFDIVVEATGSKEGLDEALRLVRPRGTVVLKTTVAERRAVDLNKVVIDEITIVGSRCGPFAPALKAVAEKKVDVSPLISKVFQVEEGIKAFEYASTKGVLKVLIRM